MLTTQFFKGLLMALIAILVTAFSQSPIQWGVLIITVIGTVLVYVGKNAFVGLQSDSPAGAINFKNIISALLIAIGSGITEYIALIVVNGIIDWMVLLKVAGSVTLTYLASTFFSPPNSKNTVKVFVI